MALTAAQIETRIETLQEGLALVEAGTQFSDRGVTYRSVDQIQNAIAYFERLRDSLTARSRQHVLSVSKGFR